MTNSHPRWLLATIVLATAGLALGACTDPPSTSNVPGAPTAVSIGACNGGLQSVTWTAPAANGGAAIIGYHLLRDMNATEIVVTSTSSDFPCSDNTSSYNVRACNSAGCGPYAGYVAYVPPTAIAGNGVVEPGEQCDDGNALAGDGCSPVATIEPGFACIGSPSVCTLLTGMFRTDDRHS